MTTEKIAEIRAEASKHYDGKTGFDNSNRRNAYVCDHMPDGSAGCGTFTITVDREPGVTPALLKCPNCGNFAGSKFYKIADWMEPTHEWYRPETLDGLTDGERDHVERGGLLLRQIGGGKAQEGWQKLPVDEGRPVKPSRPGFPNPSNGRLVPPHGSGGGVLTKQPMPIPLNRADYPNRQQYRAAVRDQRKGRA